MKQYIRFQNAKTLRVIQLLVGYWVICAGTASGQGYHLGLQLTPNMSFSDPRELTHHTDGALAHFGYGFIFDAMFTESYAIGTGVNIFYTGGSSVYFESAVDPEGMMIEKIRLEGRWQYVEIPLTFKMRTKQIGYTTYHGQFGVGLGLNVRAEGMRSVEGQSALDSLGVPGVLVPILEPTGNQVSLADQTRLFRPSMIVGLGLERSLLESTALLCGIRYNMALRNQYEDFPILQSHTPDDLLLQFDESSGVNLPVEKQMLGKTGQIELCVGLMF